MIGKPEGMTFPQTHKSGLMHGMRDVWRNRYQSAESTDKADRLAVVTADLPARVL